MEGGLLKGFLKEESGDPQHFRHQRRGYKNFYRIGLFIFFTSKKHQGPSRIYERSLIPFSSVPWASCHTRLEWPPPLTLMCGTRTSHLRHIFAAIKRITKWRIITEHWGPINQCNVTMQPLLLHYSFCVIIFEEKGQLYLTLSPAVSNA